MNTNERVSYFSKILNEGEDIISNLKKAIEEFKNFEEKYKELAKYYESTDLRNDLKAENEGLIDKNVNKGVLGEDYTYNLLIDYENYQNVLKNL